MKLSEKSKTNNEKKNPVLFPAEAVLFQISGKDRGLFASQSIWELDAKPMEPDGGEGEKG
jgi:hypothetical protein